MFYVVYYRCEARVKDLKEFKDLEELSEWLTRRQKLEPTMIFGIYNKDVKISEVEKTQNDLMEFIAIT